MLAEKSSEGSELGLGWIDAKVEKFNQNILNLFIRIFLNYPFRME